MEGIQEANEEFESEKDIRSHGSSNFEEFKSFQKPKNQNYSLFRGHTPEQVNFIAYQDQ